MIPKIVVLKEASLYAISKIVPGITGLVSVVLFIRIVGAVEYGNYSFLLSQCYLVTAMGFGWLNQANLRYYLKDFDLTDNRIAQMRSIIISSLLSLVILYILISLQGISMKIMIISYISIIGIGGFNYLKTLLQARLAPLKVIWLTLIQSLMGLLIPLVFLLLFQRTGNIIFMGVGSSFLLLTVLLFIRQYINKKLIINSFKLSINAKKLIKKWFFYGSPLSFWFAAGLALSFLDRFFINQYLPSEDLGIYASSQELLTKIFSITIFPITLAIHPRVMNTWNQSKEYEAIQLIRWGIGIMSCISIILITSFWYSDNLAFSLINMLIPQFNIEYKPIIIPLLSAGLLWQFSFLTHKMLELKEQTMLMVLFILISLLINIIGNYYYLPKYGIIATANIAFATALIYCLLTGFYSLYIISKSKQL